MAAEPACSETEHDTARAYKRGCRCPAAVEAVRQLWRDSHEQRRTRRRLFGPEPSRRSPGRHDGLDEVAVRLACQGRRVALNATEMEAAVAQLTRAGEPAWRVAEILHVTPRTVVRWRGRARRDGLLGANATGEAAAA